MAIACDGAAGSFVEVNSGIDIGAEWAYRETPGATRCYLEPAGENTFRLRNYWTAGYRKGAPGGYLRATTILEGGAENPPFAFAKLGKVDVDVLKADDKNELWMLEPNLAEQK